MSVATPGGQSLSDCGALHSASVNQGEMSLLSDLNKGHLTTHLTYNTCVTDRCLISFYMCLNYLQQGVQ